MDSRISASVNMSVNIGHLQPYHPLHCHSSLTQETEAGKYRQAVGCLLELMGGVWLLLGLAGYPPFVCIDLASPAHLPYVQSEIN